MTSEKKEDAIIHVKINKNLHKKLKIHCFENEITITNFIKNLINKNLK